MAVTDKLLDALCELANVTIEVGAPLEPSAQALMDTLGVTVTVKAGAPTRPEPGTFYDPWDRRYREARPTG